MELLEKMRSNGTNGNSVLSRKITVCLALIFLAFIEGRGCPVLWALPTETGPLMSVNRLQTLSAKETVLIDTRPSWKFFVGHIPGAINLNDWREFTERRNGVPGVLIQDPKVIAQKLGAAGIHNQSKTLVVYGDPDDAWRPDGRFFWMFQYLGFERTFLLDGGFDSWVKQGGAEERGRGKSPLPGSIHLSELRFNPNVIADQKWILQRLGKSSAALVDTRDRKEFDGATPYGSARGGHIPGAIHLDWRLFFSNDGKLKSRAALSQLLHDSGIRSDQEIIVYCTGGVRSGMAFFAFQYLGFKTRNYDGSWWDWSRNPSLPVELEIAAPKE